jgi:hypothetical protein
MLCFFGIIFVEISIHMIKNIAYFPAQCANNSGPVMSAVLDSLQAAGIQTRENSWDSDAAIIWSVLWHGKMLKNRQVYDHYRSQGKPVIVLDVGALYRNQTWKLAVNNITAEGYYGHLENLNWDRPRNIGISQAMNFSTNPEIIITAQHSRSHQVAGLTSMEHWISQQVQLLRNNTDRPIRVRAHPRSSLNQSQLPAGIVIDRPEQIPNTYDSFNLRFDCHAMVNYNSGPGIQAAIAGVRTVVDSSSLAYPVSIGYSDIEQPYNINRDLWLVQICHTEYTLEELRRGLWISRIAPALERNT